MSARTTARGGRFRTTLALSAAVALSLVGTAVIEAPSGAAVIPTTHRSPTCQPASGTFTSPPLTITDAVPDPNNPALYDYTASGGDHWTGTLTGDTTYQGTGTIDTSSGEIKVFLHEVFVGSVDGVGSGRLQLSDYVSALPPGLPIVDTAVIGGHGELARVRGGLHFVTTEVTNPDPFGNGDTAGTYSGMLCR